MAEVEKRSCHHEVSGRNLEEGAPGDYRYLPQDLFEAMKVYAKNVKLPAMCTFNGLRFAVLRYLAREDPSMRREIDFDRS